MHMRPCRSSGRSHFCDGLAARNPIANPDKGPVTVCVQDLPAILSLDYDCIPIAAFHTALDYASLGYRPNRRSCRGGNIDSGMVSRLTGDWILPPSFRVTHH